MSLVAIARLACAVVICGAGFRLVLVSRPEDGGPDRAPVIPVFRRDRFPVVTVVVLLAVGVVTASQFPFPGVLETLRRDPGALASGEWWRVASPLLVQSDGWWQAVFNLVALLFFGARAEQVFGPVPWVPLFAAGAAAGEIAGYAWEPHGAGTSVGVAGLLGGLLVRLVLRGGPGRTPARAGGSVALAAAVVLAALRDIHGPALLAGAAVGAAVLWGAHRPSPAVR